MTRMRGSVSFQVVWLIRPCSCSSASRLCSVHTVPIFSRPPQLTIMPLQARRRPMPRLPRRQMAQSFGQRFLTPVTRRPVCRPHNPPCPFLTFRHTHRIQQPPRRRKSRHPNVPPVLPQQVKSAQLMRSLPAIHQLNPAAMAPSPSLTKCCGCCAPCCQARSITSDQEPKAPRAVPAAALRITFNSVRPRRVRVHRPSISSARPAATAARPKAPSPSPADRTLDAAHPVAGAGVAQSLRGQADGDVTVFWKTAGGAFPGPAASCRRPYADTARSGTPGFAGGLRRNWWQWRGA